MADYSMPSGVSFTRSGSNVWYKNTTSSQYLFFVGDTLIDNTTGDKYECKARTYIEKNQTSYRLTTDWKYLRTEIIKPVSVAVTDLACKRNSGYSFSLSWKNPSALTDSNKYNRAEKFSFKVELLYGSTVVASEYLPWVLSIITSMSITVFATSNSTSNYVWLRTGFYPYTSKKVDTIRFTVQPRNSSGAYDSAARTITYKFVRPKYPELRGTYTIDRTTGAVSRTYSSPVDTSSEYDKVWTQTKIEVYDSRTKKRTLTSDVNRTESSFTLTQQIPNRHTLAYGDYVNVFFRITAKGIAGDAETGNGVVESFPVKPLIQVKATSEDWTSGSVIIGVDAYEFYSDSRYDATNVKLQLLRSTAYENAQDIPPIAQWRDIGPVEPDECTAISLKISEVLPDAGTFTWIRAKSWNDVEELYYRYSEPLRLKDLETPAPVIPSAQDDIADVLSHVVNVDGTSVDVLVGWDANGQDDSNKTEVTWSTNEKAWRSTKQPDTFKFDDDWNEGSVTVGSKTYNKSAHVTISELEPDTKYYVSCRRVLEPDEGDTTYGPYSTKYIVNTSDVSALPQSVALYSNGNIVYGEPIQLSWSYNSPMEQQSWMIKKAVNSSGYSDNDIVLAMENDPRHTLKVPFYRDENKENPIVDEDELRLYVVVTVASVTLTSEIITLDVLKKPEFDIVAPSMTIVQPATLAVFSDNKGVSVSYFIEAKNVVSEYPNGTVRQSDGDTVWSETVNPQWELIDEYAADSDVQQAKQDLDDAQEAYDVVFEQYQEAVSRKEDAQSRIETLTVSISNAQRDIPTAQATLQDAEDRLENTDADDPMYELYATQVQEAEGYLQGLEDRLQADTVALSEAEDDLQDAISDIESIDMSDEEEALEDAIQAYATAETEAIDPTSDVLAYKAIITLPSYINVIDGARYIVHGFSTNTQSGLRSDERTAAMNVEWSHQSPMPYEDITIEPIDHTDDGGVRTIGTNITLERPVNAFNSDVYDVYRITKGGISLAAENVPLECVLFDPYATFSGELMHYRIACRTADGDVTWKDYSYLLNESEDVLRSAMRIDWENEYVELERNVVPSDSYEKPFVSHTHLDGTVSGHWNAGTKRTMNVQAALVRSYDNRQREAIENLARYDGPCYVRTNDGVAFECNVQVDSIALNRHSARIDVSMTMTEIEATGTFMAMVEEQA